MILDTTINDYNIIKQLIHVRKTVQFDWNYFVKVLWNDFLFHFLVHVNIKHAAINTQCSALLQFICNDFH